AALEGNFYPRGIHVFDLKTGRTLVRLSEQGQFGLSFAFSPDGTLLAAADGHRIQPDSRVFHQSIRLWDTATRKERFRFGKRLGGYLRVAFSPDGKTLATGGEDARVCLWEVATGGERRQFAGHTGRVTGLVFGHDGRTLISGSADSTALVWDLTG